MPELTTAAKGACGALVLGGGGTGIYFGIRYKREFEEKNEEIVTEDASKRLKEDSDWNTRESSYFDSYIKVNPDGDMRILYLPTSKAVDEKELLIKKWCNRRWEVNRIISLTLYWCYNDKITWLEKAKTEKNSSKEWELNRGLFNLKGSGTVDEFKKIEEKIKLGTDERKFFDSVKNKNSQQFMATVEWCEGVSGLFYEKSSEAYTAFKENCLMEKKNK